MTTTAETGARVGEYEVMFLAGQAAAAQLGSLVEHIDEIVRRANGEFIALRKWDERRLAYEIDKQKRGVYFLAYLRCAGDQIAHIERDVAISDRIMRVLITRADHLTLEEMTSHDLRDELMAEAKLRGEQADKEEDQTASKVRLGAPEEVIQAQQAPQQPEPAAEAPEGDSQGGDEAKAEA